MECELCGKRATMYCESDQAKLCWGCDEKVHGANFLVAKHNRILLCRACQSPTPWNACGPKLTPTTSVCDRCVTNHSKKCERSNGDDEREEDHNYDSDDDYESFDEGSGNNYDDDDDEEEEEEEEEEGENQVVPWSFDPLPSHVPASSINSDSDGDISNSIGGADLRLKRLRENSLVDSDDENEMGCSSSTALPNDERTSMRLFRPLKQPHRW
ncbi:hypothetical protein L6164_022514 [Bauhinia variegata]|uniref:Uncharacterized protein n=1 Tax=Bauhinia variegata TaxID=167791 RepID=A0ACB9MGV0_BAUVA|nr:hypothetical protein L6164_022514 [Bauhinia variegata]